MSIGDSLKLEGENPWIVVGVEVVELWDSFSW